MAKKHFSLQDSQELIPTLKDDVIRLVSLKKSLSLLNSIEFESDDPSEEFMHDLSINKQFHKLF